jgi:hypothetical protein
MGDVLILHAATAQPRRLANEMKPPATATYILVA